MTAVKDKFDFDIGHLVKSPCINCNNRKNFPGCSDNCKILDRIRGELAKGVSSSYSAYEP